MSDFIDPFPNLSQVIDVSGDKYFMGSQKPIELGFKSRKNYLDSFGTDQRTEYLLRKYLFLSPREKYVFDSPEDKEELIKILENRAKQLEMSKEFTSSVIKNTSIQKSHLNILQLIQNLKSSQHKNVELAKAQNKKAIPEITDEQKVELILEIAWFLLHPDKVPSKIRADWTKLISELNTLRLGDIVSEIRQAETEKDIPSSQNAFNYFKKINLGSFVKSDKLENALDQAKRLALEIQDNNTNEKMKERIKTLLKILTMKKYLSNETLVDPDRINIITNDIKKSMTANPISGGVSKKLDKPLEIAMNQLYDYFKVVYEPIYSFVESSFNTYSKSVDSNNRVKLHQLITLLHTCNNLNPSETREAGQNTYGIYKIINIDNEIVNFINFILKTTATHLSTFPDDKDKNTFNQQLFKLPKVHFTSLLNNFVNKEIYKDLETTSYIQFLTVGGNVNLNRSDIDDDVSVALKDYFNTNDLYILCTKSENISENIPMNVYQIDYNSIDVSDHSIKIDNLSDNYFNKNRDNEFYLEKLVTLSPYVVFNDSELALSIFIAFKELLSK